MNAIQKKKLRPFKNLLQKREILSAENHMTLKQGRSATKKKKSFSNQSLECQKLETLKRGGVLVSTRCKACKIDFEVDTIFRHISHVESCKRQHTFDEIEAYKTWTLDRKHQNQVKSTIIQMTGRKPIC